MEASRRAISRGGYLVAEDRQRKRGFGDEHVARHDLERHTGGIGAALVVARDDGALPVPFENDLRRTEHVASRNEADADAADGCLVRRAVVVSKRPAASSPSRTFMISIVSGGGEHGAVAGAGVIAMAVGDDLRGRPAAPGR